jgi:hypothetical protein
MIGRLSSGRKPGIDRIWLSLKGARLVPDSACNR